MKVCWWYDTYLLSFERHLSPLASEQVLEGQAVLYSPFPSWGYYCYYRSLVLSALSVLRGFDSIWFVRGRDRRREGLDTGCLIWDETIYCSYTTGNASRTLLRELPVQEKQVQSYVKNSQEGRWETTWWLHEILSSSARYCSPKNSTVCFQLEFYGCIYLHGPFCHLLDIWEMRERRIW